MNPATAWIPLLEILVLCGGVFSVCRRVGFPFSEAVVYGSVVPMMALSFLLQTALLLRVPWLSPSGEGLLFVIAIAALLRCRSEIAGSVRLIAAFARRNPLAATAAAGLWSYLLIQALLLPPDNAQWHDLTRAILLRQEGSPDAAGASIASGPLNGVVLATLFLRHGSDWGVGLLGFLSYMGIVGAAYATARRFAWPPTALTVTFIVLGLPRLVLLASTPDPEILAAAAAAFCLLALFRAMEAPTTGDVLLLCLAIPFCMAEETLGAAFPISLTLLGLALLTQRHGAALWWRSLARHRLLMLAALLPMVVFSQLWRPAHGQPEFEPNPDGIPGALTNSAHYLALGVDLPPAVNELTQEMLGKSVSGLLEGLFAGISLLLGSDQGRASRFSIVWQLAPATCGFGPLALLLVFPALINSLVRGTRLLRSVALALAGYFFLVALVPAWQPENIGYLSVIYVCSAPCLAFWLPPWRLSLRLKHGLQIAAAMIGLYAALGNSARPLLDLTPLMTKARGPAPNGVLWRDAWSAALQGGVWQRAHWGRDRFEPARRAIGGHCVERLLAEAPTGEPLIFISHRPELAYPFMAIRPDSILLPPGHATRPEWAFTPEVCGEAGILVARIVTPQLPPGAGSVLPGA